MPIPAEALPALDVKPRKRPDRVVRSNEDPEAGIVDGDPETEGEMSLGFILDEADPKAVARYIEEEVEDQEPAMTRNRAVWKRSAWWREGKRWVRLEKKENQSLWEAKLPPGMANAPPVPNKTDRLCRRTANVIMVDPPYPECEPGDNSPEAKDAAEFSTRYLSVRGSPNELNMSKLCRNALGKAMTFGSTFAWVIMDPTAAGHRPRRVLAHPNAVTQDEAELDPETGTAAPEESLLERYVRPDRTLTDDPNEADIQWLPNHRVRLLTGKNLIFLPATADGIRDANGVIITDHTTLGDLREQFPDEIATLTPEELEQLCTWKPDRYKDILPLYAAEPKDQRDEKTKEWKDAQMVWTRTVYFRRCAEYPKGCYAIKAGKETMLYRETWTAMMEQPQAEDGSEQPEKEEVLEPPIAQLRCRDDHNFDNPYGIGLAEQLGPADEIRASSLGYQLEYMFRFGNPIQFLPMGTVVQPKQLQLRDGNPVYFNPQGQPVSEDIPALPPIVPQLRDEMSVEMDDEAGLQQTAQGAESKDVHSGVHARTVVQEALKAISDMKDNTEYFYIDLNRIILEQSRAFCTVETLLSYTGEDGEYKQKAWSRNTFRNTKVVGIRRGSFTMHTPVAKQELANDAFDRKIITVEEYQEMAAGGISPILGYQENPHLMRIRRQLDAFDDGPPEGWLEAFQAHQESLQAAQDWEAQREALAGIGVMPDPTEMPPEVLPPPPNAFTPLPIDDLPEAAKIRFRQLTRFMAASKYAAFDPAWTSTLQAEWAKAKNAAGVMTVPEVQAMQAQQAAQQQEMRAQGLNPDGTPMVEPPPPSAPPAPAGGSAPPVIQNIMPQNTGQEFEFEHDEGGRMVRARTKPLVQAAAAGPVRVG